MVLEVAHKQLLVGGWVVQLSLVPGSVPGYKVGEPLVGAVELLIESVRLAKPEGFTAIPNNVKISKLQQHTETHLSAGSVASFSPTVE